MNMNIDKEHLEKMTAERDYYRKETVKLLGIMVENSQDIMVGRNYIKEKLERILNGAGIGLHPSLEKWVDSYMKKLLK